MYYLLRYTDLVSECLCS